jgi:hypothetical protein
MSWAAIALGVSAGGSLFSGISANRLGNRQLDMLAEQQRRLEASQGENMAFLNELLDRTPSDYQKEALGSNLRSMPQISSLIGQFGTIGRRQNTLNAGNAADTIIESAKRIGVDPAQLSTRLLDAGVEIDEQGQFLTNRGRSLVDGSFYNTPVGKQQHQNLLRTAAPGLSIGGARQMEQLGMASSAGEVDLITAFLLNAQENARYGDSLIGAGTQTRSVGLGRIGGILDSAMTFGRGTLDAGMNMTNRDIGIGASQLINPNDAQRSDALKMSILGSILSANSAAGAGLGGAASDVVSGMNRSIGSAATGFGTAFSDYAKTRALSGKSTGGG